MARKTVALSALLLVFFLCPYALAQQPAQQSYSHIRIIRLSYVQGKVFLTRSGETVAKKAVLNDPVGHGATLATGEGIAEVEFESGAVVRLAENSRLIMTELGLRGNGGRVSHLTLDKGTATFQAKLAKDDSFQVTTPQVQVSVPKRALFRLDVYNNYNNESRVTVRQGDATLDAHGSEITVGKGKSTVVREGETGAIELARAPERDAWDRWSDDREETIQTAASRHYLPSRLTYGASALDNWGMWFSYPGYGYVWQPYAGAGWSPFFDGFWDWVPGLGYTWVSYEPWGWLPYHYGNWLLTPYGWAWVPGYSGWFSPATVYWINCGNYIGWAPQQPRMQPPTPPAQGGTLPPGTVVNTPDGVATGGRNRRLKDLDANQIDVKRATFMDGLRQTPEMRRLAFEAAERQEAAATAQPRPGAAAAPFIFDARQQRFVRNPKVRESEIEQNREVERQRVLMPPGLLKATHERKSGVKISPVEQPMPQGENEMRGRGPRSSESARPPSAPRSSGEPRYSPQPSPPPHPPSPPPRPPAGSRPPKD